MRGGSGGGGGAAHLQTRGGRGGWGAKNHETKRDGLISDVPCETAVEGNGGRWWRGMDKVVLVLGLRIRKREAREGARG
jgi:hypothetical protein